MIPFYRWIQGYRIAPDDIRRPISRVRDCEKVDIEANVYWQQTIHERRLLLEPSVKIEFDRNLALYPVPLDRATSFIVHYHVLALGATI